MFYAHPIEVDTPLRESENEDNVWIRCEKIIMWSEERDIDKIRYSDEC